MTEKIEAARIIRVGAERLRQIAAAHTDAQHAAEILRIAAEMDEHAAELERPVADALPSSASTAA